MNVAIIDDSPEDLAAAIDYFTDYISKNHIELFYNLKVRSYNSPVEFIKSFDTEKFNLIILDIFMKELNGMQLAQFIRDKDKECSIIFLTNSDSFLLEGYTVFAAGYFIKPLREHSEEFNKTFEFIYPKLLEKHQEIRIPLIKNDEIDIPYKNIYFVDINIKHRLRINTRSQEFITTMSYEDCRKWLLTDKRFLECHYRIIINMDYIISMKDEDFVLNNGVKIPISHRRHKEAKWQYMQYLARDTDFVPLNDDQNF